MATTSEMLLGILGVILRWNFRYGIVFWTVLSLALLSWQRHSLDNDKDKQCFTKYTVGNGTTLFFLSALLLVALLSFFLTDTVEGWINTWNGIKKVVE